MGDYYENVSIPAALTLLDLTFLWVTLGGGIPHPFRKQGQLFIYKKGCITKSQHIFVGLLGMTDLYNDLGYIF